LSADYSHSRWNAEILATGIMSEFPEPDVGSWMRFRSNGVIARRWQVIGRMAGSNRENFRGNAVTERGNSYSVPERKE
ncbi:MAG: hypothetical protein ACREQ1_09550, partial [Woeseiaceae bacterium]